LAEKKETVKYVQGVMRHSRMATTTDVYMQEFPEGVCATVIPFAGVAGHDEEAGGEGQDATAGHR
jgi:hypothetical protein